MSERWEVGGFVVAEFGATTIVVALDHGLTDEKGRKLGGRASIVGETCGWGVRIHATRDGVEFGASRRLTRWRSRDEAIDAAKAKLIAQGKKYRAKYAAQSGGGK